LTSLCKYGLPTGDLYEFSALQVLRYEKKLKTQKKKDLDNRLKEREDQKRVGAENKKLELQAVAAAAASQKRTNRKAGMI